MTDQRTPGQDFLFWTKAALPWAILHFGVVITTSYVTNNSGCGNWHCDVDRRHRLRCCALQPRKEGRVAGSRGKAKRMIPA